MLCSAVLHLYCAKLRCVVMVCLVVLCFSPSHDRFVLYCRAVDKMTSLRQLLRDQGEPSVRPHLDGLCGLILSLLQYEPAQRLTARQALQHTFFHMTHDVVDLTDS